MTQNQIIFDLSMALTYLPLMGALLFLWVLPRKKWSLGLVVVLAAGGMISGFVHGFLGPEALAPVLLLGACCYYAARLKTRDPLYVVISVLILLICIVLFAHKAPGFYNQKYVDDLVLSPGAMPYSSYLNWDKPLVALFLIGFGIAPALSLKKFPRPGRVLTALPFVLAGILALIGTGFGFLAFDPKLPGILILWLPVNLLFTCMAEEALFRGFIQTAFIRISGKGRWAGYTAVGMAALLFGLAHFGGGPVYVLLSTIAGIGYGYVFYRTGRLEAAILLHWFINTLHILLFTYPALQP